MNAETECEGDVVMSSSHAVNDQESDAQATQGAEGGEDTTLIRNEQECGRECDGEREDFTAGLYQTLYFVSYVCILQASSVALLDFR